MRWHLRHLVESAARSSMLMRWIMMALVRTRLEMRLLLRIITTNGRHY